MEIEIREAIIADLDFMVWADIQTDIEDTKDNTPFSDAEEKAHQEKIRCFIVDGDKDAWIAFDNTKRVGTIFVRYRSYEEASEWHSSYKEIGRDVFPDDGYFCDVYQLRVIEAYRRQGIAKRLKQTVEDATKKRGIQMIYTHTAIPHVEAMNVAMGYRVVRRGTLWDDKVRVSLVKDLE